MSITETLTDYEKGYNQGYRDETRGRAVSAPILCSAAFAHGYTNGVDQAAQDRYLDREESRA